MVPYILAIEPGNEFREVTVEQLERFADTDGFSPYEMKVGGRRSVVQVNVALEPPRLASRGAEACFETMQDPKQVVAYDVSGVFSAEECQLCFRDPAV